MKVHTQAYFAAAALSGLVAFCLLAVYEVMKQSTLPPTSSWQIRITAALLAAPAVLFLGLSRYKGHRYFQFFSPSEARPRGVTEQAFSQKQVLEPKVVDLNPVISELTKLLWRLMGEDVQVVNELKPNLASVRVDPAQIEQVVMNLATNARDAMPIGGKLTIRTAETDLGAEEIARHPYVKPGRYVQLSVSDTGKYMDQEVQDHLFQPFVTTKEKERGSGLGLAMVYGIIKQSGGYVWASSKPGAGTTFDIYLPVVNQPAVPLSPNLTVRSENPRGTETILLLEDEDDLRTVAREFLRASGYHVLEANGGDLAIDIAQQYPGTISLVVSDVVLPEISGPSVVSQLQAIHPELKTLYISGYADAPVLQELVKQNAALMQKPFSRSELLRTVDQLLHVQESVAGKEAQHAACEPE